MNRCARRSGIRGFRRRAAGYPLLNFAGTHARRPARSPEALLGNKRPPPAGLAWTGRSAPAALARGLAVVTGLTGRRPVALIPEQPLVAPMRHNVVDHRRRHHMTLRPTGDTQRVPCQEGSPCPAPAWTVAPACRARPLPIKFALHLRRAAHPCRTVHGRLDGQRLLHKAKPAAARPGGLSGHTLQAWAKTTSCDGQVQAATRCGRH
jgi:hypothetical protein